MSASTKTTLSALFFAGLLSTGAALPTSLSALTSVDAAADGTYIWISKVTPVIFGEDSTNYDYFLFSSESTAAKEAVHAYSQAFATGDEDRIVTSFLNATMSGTLVNDQAQNTEWKCSELSSTMRAAVSSCQASTADEQLLEKRARYDWRKSTSHVSSGSAVDALAGALGRNPNYGFPTSPRSYCIYSANVQACISWSSPQNGFTEGTAEGYISDAQSVVGFNTYSAQANGILNGADVCISNRASGCT